MTTAAVTTASVIGVVGGSGGVGASVLACALAVRAAQAGRDVMLIDGCRLGVGIDVPMGVEQEPGIRWPDLASVRGSLDGRELRSRLPSAEGVPVLSYDRSRDVELAADPLREVIRAACAASEVVVIDLPQPGSVPFAVCGPILDLVVLVCGRGVAELAAASVRARLIVADCEDLRLVVRTAGRGTEFADEVADALDLPLLGPLRDDPGVAADVLHGVAPGSRGRGPLVELSDRVLVEALVQSRVAS